MNAKYQKLKNILKEMRNVMVAFSGGTDSTLLLKAAKDVLGDDLLSVTAVSETSPRAERADAVHLAGMLGVAHILVESKEMDIPEFVNNTPDRCYICKKQRYSEMLKIAEEKGFAYLADGENDDDREDYRPGTRAAQELGVRSPLRESGLTKPDIRMISKELNLPTWNKAASPCLASRIPYNSPITPEKLRQTDAGEIFLREIGMDPQLRVRHYGDTVRIELKAEDIAKLADDTLRIQLINYFKSIGFDFVTLDLEGYARGSLNKSIGICLSGVPK
jgi:pyridinium-3,5-biscarboxylic acid mononucleotide sulfurtransferase